MSDKEYNVNFRRIKSMKPNTNGFDIWIDNQWIIAEVKNILPINNGDEYGAAQANGILDDAIKLQTGRPNLRDTRSYYKFIFLSRVPDQTTNAIHHLLKSSAGKSKNEIRVKRREIKSRLEFLNEKKRRTYSKDAIYIVEV